MIYYDYNIYRKSVELLYENIKKNNRFIFKYKKIFPILRGGSVIASFLSEKLGIPIITCVKELNEYNTLVVDDIVDTGKTRDTWIKYDFASLNVRDLTPKVLYPTYFGVRLTDFVTYWWEDYK